MKRSVILSIYLPLALLLLGFLWFIKSGVFREDLITLFVFYNISFFGLSIGNHRYFSHRSFKATPFFETLLFMMGSSAMQFSPLFWAAKHRLHHKFSDKEGDPHSPWKEAKGGLLHAYFLWAFTFNFEDCLQKYGRDFLKNKRLMYLHRHHMLIGSSFVLLAGFFQMALMNSWEGFYRGVFWGGIFRIFILHNAIFTLNVVLHKWGRSEFETHDHSKNNGLLFPLILGDSWHHNHHQVPTSPTLQIKWYQIDPYYYILIPLSYLGLIKFRRQTNL